MAADRERMRDSADRGEQQTQKTNQRGWMRRIAGRRLRPVILTTSVLLAVFTLSRIGLFMLKWDELAGNVGLRQVVRCFGVGLRFDFMPIGYVMLPMVLVVALTPARHLNRAWVRRLVTLWGAGVLASLVTMEVVGAAFFMHFGMRLNWMASFAVEREMVEFILEKYPVGLALLVPQLVLIVFYLLGQRFFWRGVGDIEPIGPARRIALGVVLVGLCVLACRGGAKRKVINRATAYFSTNRLIDQLAMNNFYTSYQAIEDTVTDGEAEDRNFPFPDDEQIVVRSREMVLQDVDLPIGDEAHPLQRRTEPGTPQRDYNVVFIIAEGLSGERCGIMGNTPSHTPNFDQLCREGVFFDRMYAVGARTSRGVTGLLLSHPDIGGLPLLKRDGAVGQFTTLPKLFHSRGYRTTFFYGGYGEFDNMAPFFTAPSGGVETFVDKEDLDAQPLPGSFGVPDHHIFDKAHEQFKAMGEERFFGVILTVSNHEPFAVPEDVDVDYLKGDDLETRIANAYRYSDWALGRFMEKARQSEYFANTVFVIVADHGRFLDQNRLIDVPGFRVPCVFYAPGILPARTVPIVSSHVDVAPTLMSVMGGAFEHRFLGRNLFRVPPGDGFALLHEDDRLALVRGNRALVMRARSQAKIFAIGPRIMRHLPSHRVDLQETADLQRDMLSYYGIARQMYVPPPSIFERNRFFRSLSEDWDD
ncbi:MAG: LTA synthase family protein [Phycisphaerae bacterium]